MKNHAPQRTYFFSDTYGGSGNPLEKPDADALITTDLRGQPKAPRHREFDIFGNTQVTAHILRMVRDLHAALDRHNLYSADYKREVRDMGTGIFINDAPRTNHTNGHPFYYAELDHGISVVTTPLEVLSSVRGHVQKLLRLPNQDNGLYPNGEQFRSSYTPELLDPAVRERLPMEEVSPDEIPEFRTDWHLAYVDRFGNLITYVPNPEEQWEQVLQAAGASKQVRLTIGDTRHNIKLGTNLGASEPGELLIYGNGNIDLARKWAAGDTPQQRLDFSAYRQFKEPTIGDGISAEKI